MTVDILYPSNCVTSLETQINPCQRTVSYKCFDPYLGSLRFVFQLIVYRRYHRRIALLILNHPNKLQRALFPVSIRPRHPIHAATACLPSPVFVNRASYRRWRNNDVTSQELEVTMMLRHRNVKCYATIYLMSRVYTSLAYGLTWPRHE